MKKLILLLLPILFLSITSCDDSAGVTNPTGGGIGGIGGGGGTGTGSVTFTIGTSQGEQGGIYFTAAPSVAVKITKVTVSLPAQQFSDVLQGDGTTVYNANEAVLLQEYVGVENGQQWTFQFEGSLAGNNQTFNVTSNYTVR
ncbi:MAG: hypothetical protein IPM32_05715 [Ignavibacteriae bacterium]|nr:hypothetical protein [Ignavibacteriota bacterium]